VVAVKAAAWSELFDSACASEPQLKNPTQIYRLLVRAAKYNPSTWSSRKISGHRLTGHRDMEVSSATAGEGGNREYRQPLFAQVPCICILFRPCFPVLTVSGWLVLLYNVSSYLVVVFRNILWQNRAVFFIIFFICLGLESLRNPPPPSPNKLTHAQPRPFMNVP